MNKDYIILKCYVGPVVSKSINFEKMVHSSEEESDSSIEEFCPYDAVDSLQQSYSPNLTSEERKFMNTYTYDKQKWRQVNDFEAYKEYNKVKWRKISQLLGD